MGAAIQLTDVDRRWLSPLSLWSGILAGPLAWALDLGLSYALVSWACDTRRQGILHLVWAASLLLTLAGALLSWRAWQQTVADVPTDGGQPRQRAHFMAVLGLTTSALFAVTILAGAIPPSVLDACQ